LIPVKRGQVSNQILWGKILMENLSEFNSDRREFFRITDSVHIDYNPLSTAEVKKLIPHIQNHVQNDAVQSNQRLNSIQTSLNHLIDQINQTDRDIARALRLLDEKITLVNKTIAQKENSSEQRAYTDANLSGGGVAFFVSENYPTKTAMEIQIEFRSSGSVIHAIANVIACTKSYDAPRDTPYILRLVFSHMSEIDRNLLVKHTLSRQALDLRLNKEIQL